MTFELIKAITGKCYAKNAENSEIGRQKQRIEATVTVLLLATDYIHILYRQNIYYTMGHFEVTCNMGEMTCFTLTPC